jgi:hypothetical protein
MQKRNFRILSTITAGSLALALALAVAGITESSGPSRPATHAALAAQTGSFPPVNLDACPTLHTGYPQGGCVAQLQTELNSILGDHLTVDGLFGSVGSQTYDAVIAFQQARHLQPDGMAGPITKQALDAAVSGSTTAVPPATTPVSTPAKAPAPPAPRPCGTAEDTINLVDPSLIGGSRDGSVHLSVYWCWDGSKITYTATPYVSTTKTWDGATFEWNINTPVSIDKDPQNGGFWTRETVVTGTYQACLIKEGCLNTEPFKLDLYVFGDGVKYIANRDNVEIRPLP